MFGGWCFLAGVFLMVTGDGLTNFNEPVAAQAWPWLFVVPFGVSFVLMAIAGRLPTRSARAGIVFPPIAALLAAFALSAIFSQERSLSAPVFFGLVAIAVFCWCAAQLLEDQRLAEATWIVVAAAVLELSVRVIAWRLDEGIDQIPVTIHTVNWLGKLQLTWVFNLLAPFLLAQCIGDRRRPIVLLNGLAWLSAGLANSLLFSRMGSLVFLLTTLGVCLLNAAAWRRWIWLMGAAAAGSAVLVVSNIRMVSFIATSFFDRAQNPGIDLRLGVWGDAWRLFLSHPVFGIGIGTFDNAAFQLPGATVDPAFHLKGWHAHNAALHVLTEAGVLGLAAWAFLWYIVLRALVAAWKSGDREQRVLSSAALVSVLAFQTLSMTEVLIAARVHASMQMNLTIALIVVAGLRMALRPPAAAN